MTIQLQVCPQKPSPVVPIQLNSSKLDVLPGERNMATESEGCKSTTKNKERNKENILPAEDRNKTLKRRCLTKDTSNVQ